jgi:hypothetical protein
VTITTETDSRKYAMDQDLEVLADMLADTADSYTVEPVWVAWAILESVSARPELESLTEQAKAVLEDSYRIS